MAKIRWTEEDVLQAFQAAVEEAAMMPSPQQMAQELMSEAQMEAQAQMPAEGMGR